MRIKLVPNILKKNEFEIAIVNNYSVKPLREFFIEAFSGRNPEHYFPVVEGKRVKWDYVPAMNEEIIVMADIRGGNSSVWSIVAGAAMIVAGAVLLYTGIGGPMGYYLISTGIGLIIGGAASYLYTPPGPQGDSFKDSKTYSWSGIGNMAGEGHPVPIVYGRHRIGGSIIENFIYSKNSKVDGVISKMYNNTLLALSEGPIEEIEVDSILINNKNVDYYNTGKLEAKEVNIADKELPYNTEVIISNSKTKKMDLKIKFDRLYAYKQPDSH